MSNSRIPFTKGLHKLSDRVYAYIQPDGSWGLNNAGLILGEDFAVVVDTLYDDAHTRQMIRQIDTVLPPKLAIGYLINTHGNGDHWYGNSLFPKARIIASESCALEMKELPPKKMTFLLTLHFLLGKGGKYAKRAFRDFSYKQITPKYPDQTFKDSFDLNPGGIGIKVIDMGACHSSSDTVVYLEKEKLIFASDLLFIHGTPIAWTGPVSRMINALDRLIAMDAETYVPGHGPVTDKNGVRKVKDYFEFIYDQGAPRLKQNMSLLHAALDIDLGEYNAWIDRERLIINLHCIEKELFPQKKELSAIKLFGLMETYLEKTANGF